MQAKDLVFFCISSIAVLGGLYVVIAMMVKEYFYDYQDDRENSILSYIGYGFLGLLLVEVCVFLALLILGLFFGIDEYSLSYLGKFLNSDLFIFMDMVMLVILALAIFYMAKYYSFLDVFRYRHTQSKYKGTIKASEHVQRSLNDIEIEIKNAKKNGVSENVLKELEENKVALIRSRDDYLIKIKHLENIKIKLLSRMKENNVYYD